MKNSAWDDIDLIDINNFIDDVALENANDPYSYWNQQDYSASLDIDASLTSAPSQEKECADIECPRKRGRAVSCTKLGSKACREKLRREKLNDKFSELCATLEPGRPTKTDKLAILSDAIRALNQLRSEALEYKETNEKLLEEIKTLKAEKNELHEEKLKLKAEKNELREEKLKIKAEKNELREEKLKLKADKEKMEQELKATSVPPPGFMATHPAAYQAGMNKMAVFPGYGLVPMWQYMPPSNRDTSQDHKLRPPAA